MDREMTVKELIRQLEEKNPSQLVRICSLEAEAIDFTYQDFEVYERTLKDGEIIVTLEL